jgi:hypothetical protein
MILLATATDHRYTIDTHLLLLRSCCWCCCCLFCQMLRDPLSMPGQCFFSPKMTSLPMPVSTL